MRFEIQEDRPQGREQIGSFQHLLHTERREPERQQVSQKWSREVPRSFLYSRDAPKGKSVTLVHRLLAHGYCPQD